MGLCKGRPYQLTQVIGIPVGIGWVPITVAYCDGPSSSAAFLNSLGVSHFTQWVKLPDDSLPPDKHNPWSGESHVSFNIPCPNASKPTVKTAATMAPPSDYL